MSDDFMDFNLNEILNDSIQQAGLELQRQRPKDKVSIEGSRIVIEAQTPQAVEEISPGRVFIKYEPVLVAEKQYFDVNLEKDIDKSIDAGFGG